MKRASAGRRWLAVMSLCWFVVAGCGDSSRDDDEETDPAVVAIANGELRGSVNGGSRVFLGVPYAQPPVGELRWKAPRPAQPWTTPREATRFSARCAQPANPLLQNAPSDDEDCLYLNVWTPVPVPAAPLPVMVWFHGGGNVNGSTAEPVPFLNTGVFYDGKLLAERGVVVVTVNYRLGLFGFFGHAGLTAEDAPGNQGILDQRASLEWVRDNIAAFGGDPANVTIFGESAGSQDVCFHMASPGSRGLFHRAISQSGGCTARMRTRSEAELGAGALAAELGCSGTGADALACLRAKSSADLLASLATRPSTDDSGFGPSVDGKVLTDQPRVLFDAKQIAPVPYMLGSNTDEGTLFVTTLRIATEQEYLATLNARFGAAAPTVAGLYPLSMFDGAKPNSAMAAIARVIGDSQLVCTTHDTARRAAAAGNAVYMYNYDIPVSVMPQGVYLGATHGAELASVFGTSPVFTPDEKAASERIQRYWTNFAKTGDPNGGNDLAWPKFGVDRDVRINFALTASLASDFRAAPCELWRSVYDSRF